MSDHSSGLDRILLAGAALVLIGAATLGGLAVYLSGLGCG